MKSTSLIILLLVVNLPTKHFISILNIRREAEAYGLGETFHPTFAMFLRGSSHHLSRVFSFVQLAQCQSLILKCGYARGRGGRDTRQLLLSHKLSKIPDESQLGDDEDGESLFIDPDDDDRSRSFDDFYNVLGDRGPTVSHLKKFAKKERERLKLKILKRKYFKDSKEENLLTWETKEQIRFLHQEFPEDWTIEKLSQSFPISHNGIIKLLNSSFVIKTPEKILEHDLKVKKKWKELEADLSRKGGPINTQSKNLIESGKLYLLKNAATLKGAPRKVLQLKTESEQVGIFSSIVKSYANSKTQNEILIQTNPLDLKQLVEVINNQQNNINPVTGNASKRASAKSEGSSSVDNSLFITEPHKLPRNTRRRLKKSEEISIDDLSYLEAYQVMGTGKVLNSKKKDADNKIDENVFTERETRKYFKYSLQDSDSTAPTVQNLSKIRQPFRDSSFQTKIKIPDDFKHKKEVIYKKDDTYYDDQGDILFRIPVNK